jgi:hypothetical protein
MIQPSPNPSSEPRSPQRTGLEWQGDRNLSDAPPSKLSMQRIYQRLNTTPEQLAQFCEKWQIIELAVFGSVLRDDFRTAGDDPSDIDLLYRSSPQIRYGFTLFDMKEELEKLFNRKVDLISETGIQNSRNWLRRKSILESKKIIYAKRPAINH